MIDAATARVLQLFAAFKKEYDGLVDYKADRYTAQAAQEWAIELLEAGINKDQFETGAYLAIKRSKYPPDRVFNFIELCGGRNDGGYPDMRQAYKDAANQQYKHDVVYEAARRVGFWEMRSQPESVTYKVWQNIYPTVCAEHRAGATFKINKSHRIEQKHIPAAPDSEVMQQWDQFVRRIKGKKSCEM